MSSRRWRKMTWGIVAWSGLILGLTVVQMLMTATKNCSSFDLDDADCIRIEVNGRSAAVAEWLVRGVVIWIIGFGVLAVIAGVLAAILPARRASRLNVLEALQYE